MGEGGGRRKRWNVYVAFSVAGGTGCGLFLDILHLVEECFAERTRLDPVVHPLVALPSAFDVERGGGRTARLNAATAVIDLARYIDAQNTGEKTQVVLPDGPAAMIRATTRGGALAPTAYLFSRPLTHSQDDHVRVMATFAAANVAPASDEQVQSDLNHHQVGVNRSTERSVPAPQGIGLHPFTMACSGALSVPDVEVTMVLAESILASAVSTLRHRVGTEAQVIDNAAVLDLIRVHSGLIRAIDREPPRDLGRLRSERGADKVRGALQRRRNVAKRNIEQYEERLRAELGEVAAFDWKKAVVAAVEHGADLYQIAQVIGMTGPSQDGPSLRKDLNDIDFDAETVEEQPPEIPALQDRLGPARFLNGRFGLKPDDAAVNDYIRKLNSWQQNRATQVWRQVWRERRDLATAAYQEMADALGATIATLDQSTRSATFNANATYSRLFARRQGVVNYVPHVGSAATAEPVP